MCGFFCHSLKFIAFFVQKLLVTQCLFFLSNHLGKAKSIFLSLWVICFPRIGMFFYYIHTEKYSPKSYVVNFRSQISSSQSEERTMVFTCEKNDTSNQNRERCFFTCEKNDTSNQKPQRCGFRAKIPAFYCSLQRRFAHIQREKFYSKSFPC